MKSSSSRIKCSQYRELVAAADAEPVQPGEEFRYTLTYGHTASSAVIPDALLELPLPNGVSFVSATGGGTLVDDTVQWDLGTLDPGRIGRVQATVAVDEATAHGSLLQTQAVMRSTSQTDTIARADMTTQVEEAPSLLVSVAVRSEPAEAGEYLDLALTVSNASAFDRSDVVLKLRYPEHLDSLSSSYLSDDGYVVYGGGCDFREFVYWDIETLPAGTSKTVTLPPMITADTEAGTVIELKPLVSDSSETWMTKNRCIAVQKKRNLELLLNTGMDSIQPDNLLTYTLFYGIRSTSSSVSDTVLELFLPDNVSFISATGSGALSGDTVQWALGALEPGQVDEKQVTVSVSPESDFGYLMEAQAVLGSAGQSDLIIRADATTKIVEEMPLLLSIQAEPDPAEADEQLYTELTITNTNAFDRSDIVLRFRYPEHLDSLSSGYLSDDGYVYGGGCDFREFVYWDIETLPAGTSKTVTLPPTVSSSTIDGTLIDFDAVVYDATARSRVEHTVLIGQAAAEPDNDPKYIVLTDDTPETLASGNNSIVYGSHEANVVFLESGAVARLINFPGSNTINILSNSGLFTVSRSGATVTFTGSDGTSLVMPATSTVQTIIFPDKTLELKISSGTVMLENQTISAESASIE